jgi:mRNA interferase MazF
MKKGEIWLVEIPPTNGHEQHDLRPVLVFSPSEANVVIIIPCTSNMSSLRYPHTLEIQPSATNGLTIPSIALIFQIRAIDLKRLQHKVGELSSETVKEVDGMIRHLLAL